MAEEAIQGVIPPGKLDVCSTGANRSTRSGRGMPHLLPFDALVELSKHFEGGVLAGYEARNWEKGLFLSWYVDSAFRHLADIDAGKTNEQHFRAFAWNAVCMLATKIRMDSGELPSFLDDRRKPDIYPDQPEIPSAFIRQHMIDTLIQRGLGAADAEKIVYAATTAPTPGKVTWAGLPETPPGFVSNTGHVAAASQGG